ncbi:MAG: Peptidase family, partial [Thermomicrobiales bacterium]|nr:Peptidase family [Thermomicrobiales bacterium]
GDEVVLGHLGRIVVKEGERVKIGQFVGLSGGENGDHLHLEVRELQPLGGYRIVDPRKSFVVKALKVAAEERGVNDAASPEAGAPRERPIG